jgi:hypothetical protein
MTVATASLRRLALGAVASVVACAALAEGSVSYASIEATSDHPVQLSYHGSAHRGNCSAAPVPTVRVTEPPKEGALVVREGVLTTDKVAGCPQLKIPAEVVFYEARAGYTGPDHVAYQVTDEKGQVASYDVTITVKEGSAPSEPSKPEESVPSEPSKSGEPASSKPNEPGSGAQ